MKKSEDQRNFLSKKKASAFRGMRTHFVAGAALSQGQVQISWQAQHFRKDGADFLAGAMLSQVRYRFHGRRSTFARSGTEFVAGAGLLQDQAQTPWQEQYFR